MNLLDAAEHATRNGEACSDFTILIGGEGGIRMLAGSDWPLDSLVRQHEAKTAYRISEHDGAVRVEGREGSRSCVLESVKPARVAKYLLGWPSLRAGG